MNWKGWIAGVVVAVTAGGAILAGTAVHGVAGAGTDVVVATATPTSVATQVPVASPTPTAAPANPPQSAIEPPAAPGPNLAGGPAGVNTGPNALPSTGDGSSLSRGGVTSEAAWLAVVATILFGAGASAFAARRRG